jgi:hypothetical protein
MAIVIDANLAKFAFQQIGDIAEFAGEHIAAGYDLGPPGAAVGPGAMARRRGCGARALLRPLKRGR